jgi:GNAT superfamily N-acetyltransferase
MKIEVHNSCTDFSSYRAARVKSLFNAPSGANFDLSIDLPIEDGDWKIGLIVGPSGSGKTSLGRQIFGSDAFYNFQNWPHDQPIVDAIAPGGDFNEVTGALAAVGLGSVPSWLRPFPVLSNGEQFRANLARIIVEAPAKVVIDEFTSVVDRQIAKFGALAFQKAWRRTSERTSGQCVLLSCHYDIVEWVEPDWVYDTATGQYSGRGLWRRPKFELELWETDWRYWHLFEPHHYLKLPHMIAATNYVGVVDGELVAHVGVATRPGLIEARACRLVVMPEWQGAGIGMRFLNAVCQRWLEGENRYHKKMRTLFHTSHPGLCAGLRRDPKWVQVSANLYGDSRARSIQSLTKSARKKGNEEAQTGYGGHFRAVQGFRYLGAR